MTSGKEDDDVSVTVTDTDTDTEVEGIIMTNNNNNNKSDEEAQIIEHAVRSLPSHAAAIDLLSSGVCVRCILRLFGVSGRVYSCSLLSSSYLYSVLEKSYSSHDYSDTWRPSIEAESLYYCSVCLGILQFCHTDGKVKDQVSEFTLSIAEMVKKEGHEIESFCFEISVPPIISANENAIWLCMKNKYGSELWCQEEKLLAEHVSLKDALKMSVTDSLETLLDGKYALGSFHICLTYTQTKASSWLLGCQDRNQDFKRRKTETVDSVQGLECSEDASGEVGSAMDTSLNGLQDSESFNSAPEKVKEPCCLTCHCYRTPIYVGGRYLKYSRNVSQTRWIIDDERMGEASVEEIIGNTIIPICRGDKYKFHAAGREDIDVRMLGSGRPFLVEVQNARHDPSKVEMTDIEEKINNSEIKLVRVKNLKVVGNQGWTLMREGEAEKQKQYAALVWISRSLGDEDLNTLSSLKDMQIVQRTPVRVLHRRSPLDREKIIHWMKVEKIVGSTQYFLLHLCTQAGTYIKEFVHGDLGRTQPSIGSILGCRAEILLLDVTDVKMDCFN